MKKLSMILFVFIFIFSCSSKKDKIDFGYVSFYYGNISIIQSGKEVKPKLKLLLKSGDIVKTLKNARMDIQLEKFGIIRINQNSVVDLEKLIKEANQSITLGLDKGQVLCKLVKLQKGQDFTVNTPTAVAGVRGTTFLVNSEEEKKSEVVVSEGTVEVANKSEPEKTTEVKQNETARVESDKSGLNIMKGIKTDQLKELTAFKDVKVLKNIKDIKVDTLKDLSVDNLKKLNIKDVKGLGNEFQSLWQNKGGEGNKGNIKEDIKGQVDTKKEEVGKQIEEKKEEVNQKVDEVKEQKEKVDESVDKAKEKLKGMFK